MPGPAGLETVACPESGRWLCREQGGRFRGREVDTAGDAVFATLDGPARAIRCASAIADELKALGPDVRVGVHRGEVVQVDGHVRGIAVDIAKQLAEAAQPGEVAVSSTVKDFVAGSGIAFDDRGEREFDGVSGTWHLFAVARRTEGVSVPRSPGRLFADCKSPGRPGKTVRPACAATCKGRGRGWTVIGGVRTDEPVRPRTPVFNPAQGLLLPCRAHDQVAGAPTGAQKSGSRF